MACDIQMIIEKIWPKHIVIKSSRYIEMIIEKISKLMLNF